MPPRPRITPKKPATGGGTPEKVSGGVVLPPIMFSEAETAKIISETKKSIAKRMGVSEDALPASVIDAIKVAATNALSDRTKTIVMRDADKAAKETLLTGVSPLDLMDQRLKAAKEGVSHIVANLNVDAVLKDTANLLWKKFQAFKSAGFDDSQSFSLLIAEVEGRAARGR